MLFKINNVSTKIKYLLKNILNKINYDNLIDNFASNSKNKF